jgi:BirA family transcriptional regulator, biotin operon repressor / biotin---[acetyl-CoA-carboxylase] ligase
MAGDSADLRVAYLAGCTTIQREVRVELPGGRVVHGNARTIDLDGRLVVDTTGAEVALGAGDVVHVR